MSQQKALFKDTIIYAIGSFGSKALNFLLIPLYTFYLTKEEFGIYDLFIGVLSFLIPILTLQISDSIYRWLIMESGISSSNERTDKIITNGMAVVVASVIIGLILVVSYMEIARLEFTLLFAFVLITSSLLPVFQSILRGLGLTRLYSITGIINTAIILVCNLIFIIGLKLKIEGLFLAAILGNAIILVVISYSVKLFSRLKIIYYDLELIKEFLKYSLPLVPNMICWWLINIADKYLILMFLTVEHNGTYAVASRFPSIVVLINSIFLLAWQDHSMKSENTDENTNFRSRLFNRFVQFQFSLVFFLILATPLIFNIFISDSYSDSLKYIPFLYLGAVYSAMSAYVGVGYQLKKQTKGVFYTTLIGGALNILISVIFLKRIGLYAPAIGSFVSFLLIYIIRKKQTKNYYKIEVDKISFSLYNIAVLALIGLGLCYQLNDYFRVLLIFLALVFFAYLNRYLFSLLKK